MTGLKRLTITLDEAGRALAHQVIDQRPDGWEVAIMPPGRTASQNKALWPKLQDLSAQVIWYGETLTDWDWKDVMTASLRKSKVVPTIEGDGLVPLGLHTSEMSEEEFAALLALIDYFGAQQSVRWTLSKRFERERLAWRKG